MMDNDNKNNLPLDVKVSTSKEPIGFEFNAGEKGSDAQGKQVNDSDFVFVQQDKKIHDTKFTTRPTTFFKDAFRRFRKSKSSVVAGIILGMLFALALILPFEMNVGGVTIQTLPYDIDNKHNYETNLPMKLLPAGTGFWDGTRVAKNQSLPYELDSDGNINYDKYIGEYDDPSVILDIRNISEGYVDFASSSGTGGYARINKFASADATQTGYMVFSKTSFDLDKNDYTLSYTLGTRSQGEYKMAEYALCLVDNNGIVYPLQEFTTDYGTATEKENKDMTITPHETVSDVSLNELIDAAELDESILSKQFSVGFAIHSDTEYDVEFFLKDFTISGKTKEGAELSLIERYALKNRSFGHAEDKMKDANTMVLQEKEVNGKPNENYWSSVSDSRFDAFDVRSIKCDLVIDSYAMQYGFRKDITIDGSTIQKWVDQGYVTYDFTKNNVEAPKTFSVTDAGNQSGEVYVQSVESQSSSTDAEGNKVYSLSCTVLMYKYLGYDSMPTHLFGTDREGKDILKNVFAGLRTSLLLGTVVALINITFGVIWGSISGYFGGWTDLLMERFTDILVGIPWIVLMTVLCIKLGQNFFVFALALCLTGWIGTESITRSQFYRYKGREYVLAARTLGASAPRLIFRHILPNAVGPIITSSVLMIPSTIFSEATISYLGLGLQNLSSLGVILSDAQKNLSVYPYQMLIPAIIISLLMICFNLFGNGLRDAFNPSLKGSE